MSCEALSLGCKPASAAARLRAALRRPAILPIPSRRGSLGNAIGLAIEEHPLIAHRMREPAIEPGGVYSLRVGLSDERGHAIVSAMVAVHEQGNEVLWSSPEAAR